MALFSTVREDGTWGSESPKKEVRERSGGKKKKTGGGGKMEGGCQTGGSRRGNKLKVANKTRGGEPSGKCTRTHH